MTDPFGRMVLSSINNQILLTYPHFDTLIDIRLYNDQYNYKVITKVKTKVFNPYPKFSNHANSLFYASSFTAPSAIVNDSISIQNTKYNQSVLVNQHLLLKFDLEDLNLSLEEMNDVPLNIYPNPTSGILNVAIEEKGLYQIELYNAQGALIFIESNRNNLDVQLKFTAPPGLYTLLIRSEENLISKKILVL